MMLPSHTLDARTTSLVHAIPCPVVAVDREGRVVLWNPAAERLLGYSAADALGRAWDEFLAASRNGELHGHVLRHRQGRSIDVTPRSAPGVAPEDGAAYFLEPTDGIVEATERVVRDVLQLLPAFFSIIGTDLRYRMVCRSCEILFGRRRDQIEGQLLRDMFGADAFTQFEPLIDIALTGEPAHGEFHAVGADGKKHHLRVHLQPLRLGAHAVAGVFAFAYDVTELRETEATLRQKENRLTFLIESNPDLIVIIDRDYKLKFINHTEPDPQTRPEDMIGMNVLDISPSSHRDWMRHQYEVVLQTGKPIDLEAPIHWRGQVRWFSSRLVALPGVNGPPEEILIVSREITQRIAIEQALRESESRFRQFAESLDDVVWIHDFKPDHVSFLNQSFERVWGIPRQRVYDDPMAWMASIHEDDRARVVRSWQGILDGSSREFDLSYRIARPDGSIRWIHDRGVVICDEQGSPVRLSGLARDITARRQAEEEKEAFQRQLQETQKLESLGVLAGGIAHDFNNLLAGILNNVNLAQLDLGTTPGIRARLEQIEIISQRASDLCKQMLAYAGKGRFVVGPFDINNVIREISQLVNISISKKAMLSVDLTPDLPAIRGDSSQMRQVLLNLVINATEAFGERVGSVRISTGSRLKTAEQLASFHFGGDLRPGAYVFLEVSDNGPGMPPEVLDRIFEPFFTTKFTGRGLGLAAVQGIIRGHGGAIRVASSVDMGTTFTLLLPPADDAALPVLPPPEPISMPACAGEVLIVDDEEIIRSTLSMMLEAFGFTVLTASDGREAIEIFKHRHPHLKLALLDLTMPILSGEEAHSEMVQINPSVPVIFMSGYTEQELADRSHGHPIAGFLQKPFHIETLEQLIARVTKEKPADPV